MTLPSIVTPEYTTNIPSTGQEIKFRPFLVKEEKILLTAQEGGELKEQLLAIAQILADCISTPDISIGSLATFDIEYLFLKLRAKSVGENIQINLTHQDIGGPSGSLESACTHKTEININIDNIDITRPIPDKKIQLTDSVGVCLRFPSFQDLATEMDINSSEYVFDLLSKCIEYVYDQENVYNEFTLQEMSEWIDGLGQNQFQKITVFFENIPKLKHNVEWTCEACGKEESMMLEGMESFFS